RNMLFVDMGSPPQRLKDEWIIHGHVDTAPRVRELPTRQTLHHAVIEFRIAERRLSYASCFDGARAANHELRGQFSLDVRRTDHRGLIAVANLAHVTMNDSADLVLRQPLGHIGTRRIETDERLALPVDRGMRAATITNVFTVR